MGDPRWSSLLLKDCTPLKGHHTVAREKHDKEREAERSGYGLITAHHSFMLLVEGGDTGARNDIGPGKKGVVERWL